ncbi:hypothetical protein E8E11_003871 [Didymella keratinophila]|nr:hypothetical protein E8E11_003871 [Didymella keratinophila]
MAKGRGYYTDDDEYSDDELYEMRLYALQHYLQQGYSMIESVKLSTEYVERKTGFGLDPEDVASLLEKARRIDRMDDIRARSTPSGRSRKTASSRAYDYDEPRHTQKPSRSAQPTSGSEYDRMFQNGADKFASRTSGKVLSTGEIEAYAKAMIEDLLAEGKSLQYAEQKVDQFVIRESGKRVAALRKQDHRFPDEVEDEELEAAAPRNARRETGQKYREPEYDDEDDHYGAQRTRSGYNNRRAESEETYDTSHPYTVEDLKIIRKKIYTDWVDKGCSPEEAKLEAEKWYFRAKKNRRGGKPSRSSGFDSFSDMQDALDNEDDYPRQKPQASRGSRSSKTASGSRGYRTEERRPPGWDGPKYDKYFTEEPQDDYRSRGKTGGGSPGYRTEEYRPGGSYSSGSYGGYNEPGGVKPAVDLYKLLGASKKATVSEITKAWKKLCLKYHPDRVNDTAAKQKATDKMAQINEAKDVLADAELREYYDRTGLIASMGESPDA